MKLVYQPYQIEKGNNDYPKTKGNLILFLDETVCSVYFFVKAISGGWGRGSISHGIYTLSNPSRLVDTDQNKPYKSSVYPWWISLTPIIPLRGSITNAGLHGDGNVAGSEGCICPIEKDVDFFETVKPLIDSGQLKHLEVL